MITYGAYEIFKSQSSINNEEDIDNILLKGE